MAPKVKWLPKKPGALTTTTSSQPSASKPSEILSHKIKCPSKVSSNKTMMTIKQANQTPPLKATTAKKPKPPKPVPYLTFKKNPYLGVGKVGDEDKLTEDKGVTTVIEGIELASAEDRLKRKSIKMVAFKPPLKKKCSLQSCEQCNMVKCGVCSACLNPHWKKRCKSKSKCPRLYPNVKPNLSEANSVHPAVSAKSNQLHEDGVLSALSDLPKTVSAKSSNIDVLTPPSNLGINHDGASPILSEVVNIVENLTGPELSLDSGSVEPAIAARTVSEGIVEPVSDAPGAENPAKEKSLSVSPEHHQMSNKVKWKCTNCSKVFTQFKSFNKHKCENMKTKIPCASCNKLISKKFMPMHVKMHSKLKSNCPKCSRSFVSQENLNKHMSIHEIRVHSCSICGEVFKTNSLMVKHIHEGHEQENEKSIEVKPQIKCRFCEIHLENLAKRTLLPLFAQNVPKFIFPQGV